MPCFVDSTASTFPKESPSDENPSSVSLSAHEDEAETDVSYMSNQLTFEDVLPDNYGVVARPSNESDQPVQCEFLLVMGTKSIVLYGSGTRHASTMQGGWYQVVVLPKSAGRSHVISTSEPRTHGRKPSMATIRQFVQSGSSHNCECSFGATARIPHNHLRVNFPFVSIKAHTNTGTGGAENPGSCLWMRNEVALAKYSLDYGGARVEHRAAAASRGPRSAQPLTWTERLLGHSQAWLLWQIISPQSCPANVVSIAMDPSSMTAMMQSSRLL